MNNKNYHQGFYKIKNPQKYKGNPNNIVYRSSWELKILNWLDQHPNVIWFASEELKIPYLSPLDGKIHMYFPDFVAKIKDKHNNESIYMLEVKPFKQTQEPVKRKSKKAFIQESMTYAVNQEKWKAADIFCKKQGWQFKIITEKEIGLV
jgi:hypothetical protein